MAIRLVPPALVSAARVVLQQQGLNPNLLAADGTIAADDAIALFYDTVTIETAYSPPVTVKINGPSDPSTRLILEQLRPSLTFRGRAGTYALQPYGAPTSSGSSALKTAGGVAVGLVGVWMLAKAIL